MLNSFKILLVLLLCLLSLPAEQVYAQVVYSEGLEGRLSKFVALAEALTNDQPASDQSTAQKAWRELVDRGSANDLPLVLGALKGVGPMTQNWLRAAADTLAERELRETGKLPSGRLEKFVLDGDQPARGRRVAYEWLVKVDASTPTRLLPRLLDDQSTELRYDAVAQLLNQAEKTSEPKTKLANYQRAFRSARDREQVKQCVEALKKLGQQPSVVKQMGFLIDWEVVGPFSNAGREGFVQVYPPENTIDLEGSLPGKEGAVQWKAVQAEQQDWNSLGYVDLNVAVAEEKSILAYAYTTFLSESARQVECRYDTKGASKLWVNGVEVAAENIYHSGGDFDQYIVPCSLRQGVNHILIKVCQNEQTEPWTRPWEFRLRVTDRLGGAIAPADE